MSNLPIRPEFVGRLPYGAPQLDVPIRLNTNENPYQHDETFATEIVKTLQQAIIHSNRYPDRDAVALRAALASYLNQESGTHLTKEQIWAANGSNEILLQLSQLFGGPGRYAVGFEPSYSMHPLISEITNTDWRLIKRDMNFNIDPSTITDAIEEANLVFVCTPNNPTGNSTPLDLISEIHNRTKGIVIVDEAYAEFSPNASATTLLSSYSRLAVVRTMSKAFGFAGIRLGYVAGSTDLIAALQLVRLPYHLSSLTQQAAITTLSIASQVKTQVQKLVEERKRITEALRKMGLKVINSDANFLLFGQFENQSEVWQYLLDRGILVRDVGITGWLRVTCGTEIENSSFIKAMLEYLESETGRAND